MSDFDVAIIGAGIAGASLAAEIAAYRSVVLIEAEDHPGYHSTGRSAAFWDESYGGSGVQPLTTASGPFLANPPADFYNGSFLRPRGALYLGTDADKASADRLVAEFAESGVSFTSHDKNDLEVRVSGLLPAWTIGLWQPRCADIDVAALHAAYLKRARVAGSRLERSARLEKADWRDGRWHIAAGMLNCTADVLVNAAGAWADEVAVIAGVTALGIQPYRRTIVQLSVDPQAPADLPLIIALDGSFYFKPDSGGTLWLSPHDETAVPASDVAPEEIDVALAIDRLQDVVNWNIRRVGHKWAGLRSFAPDRLPVIGPDRSNPQFFWLAGQGGFGIQTAPAIANLAGSMLVDNLVSPAGINAATYLPDRLT